MTENNEKRVKPYPIDFKLISDVCKQIFEEYGVEVQTVEEKDTCYKFYGKYDIELGTWSYDFNKQEYRPFNFNLWAVSAIKNTEKELANNNNTKEFNKEPEKPKKGRFDLQKNVKRGIAFAASSMAILVGLGVIRGINNKNNTANYVVADPINTGIELKEANDLVVLSWADYAMNEISNSCSSSPYEVVQRMSGEIRTNYYAPLVTNYYNYLDQVDSFLPEELIAQAKNKERENFRSKAVSFNKRLDDPYFKDLVFEKTPYVQAIAVDSNGVAITENGEHKGEVIDSEGNTLTYADSSKWSLYIPVLSIPGNIYELGNLPEDTILHNGEVYVGIEHYNDFTKENDVKNKI